MINKITRFDLSQPKAEISGMSKNHLEVARRSDGVAVVTMSRPEVYNAFDDAMIAELDSAFAQLASDDTVRVIMLTGSGKHFCAGADLDWMRRTSKASAAENLTDARRLAAMLDRIDRCPKPTLARIQGAALGGGTGLVCVCDVAIVADNASFAISEARFGILPATIGPYLINAVGKRQAQRLALTTTRIHADEALAIGLAHQVAALDELDTAIDGVLQEMLACGPTALGEIKTYFAGLEAGPVTEAMREHSAQTISRVRNTDEAREGLAAFLEKRAPNWISR